MSTLPESSPDATRPLRLGVYAVLIAIAAGNMLGRVLAVNAVDTIRIETYLKGQGRDDWRKQRPFLSSNDRSRWATVRALVEHGTYAIDDVISQPNWDTIDIVKHDGQGREAPQADHGHIYSSKPPLLPTLMAGPYWLICQTTGATLGTHPFTIGRTLLVLYNVLPMLLYFLLLCRLAERWGRSDWGRVFVVACGTLGTFLTTFAVVINNHLVAAVSAMVALDAALRIWYEHQRRLRWFFLAGLAAAFTAANELPALAFLAALTAALLWKAPRPALLACLPGVVVVAAAFFGTNYLSHNTLVPPYAHRQPGDNWYKFQFVRDGKVRDSYWSDPAHRSPIDQGEPRADVYALHALVGHHGIFSLTPVWLLSVVGLAMLLLGRDSRLRAVAVMIAVVSIVCITFYLTRGQEDRNYGGSTSGFRWVFWFAPMWLLAMLPAADWAAQRRWAQTVAVLLLTLSVLSASYPTWNPWTHPWILDFLLSFDLAGLGNR